MLGTHKSAKRDTFTTIHTAKKNLFWYWREYTFFLCSVIIIPFGLNCWKVSQCIDISSKLQFIVIYLYMKSNKTKYTIIINYTGKVTITENKKRATNVSKQWNEVERWWVLGYCIATFGQDTVVQNSWFILRGLQELSNLLPLAIAQNTPWHTRAMSYVLVTCHWGDAEMEHALCVFY